LYKEKGGRPKPAAQLTNYPTNRLLDSKSPPGR
jgi:hypothetical protein